MTLPKVVTYWVARSDAFRIYWTKTAAENSLLHNEKTGWSYTASGSFYEQRLSELKLQKFHHGVERVRCRSYAELMKLERLVTAETQVSRAMSQLLVAFRLEFQDPADATSRELWDYAGLDQDLLANVITMKKLGISTKDAVESLTTPVKTSRKI